MTTFARLRDGSWGARGKGLVSGASVTITRRDGSASDHRIDQIVWTGPDGTQLASIGAKAPALTAPRSRRGGCHTDSNCSSMCNPATCPCGDGGWFRCC